MQEQAAIVASIAEVEPALDLPTTVAQRLRAELGPETAEDVINCLRTAKAFLIQLETDQNGLRLAASAAYNLREALNRIVSSHDPAEGGLRLVLTSWRIFQEQLAAPQTGRDEARETFESVMRRVEADEARANSYALKLITHLRQRTGVDPLVGVANPVKEFQALLQDVNSSLHGDLSHQEATSLFDRTISWFDRMFTPPDEVAQSILDLAAQRWVSPDQTDTIARLATNSHHLRLLFGALQDSAWLSPLHTAGIVGVPVADTVWPAASLTNGLGKTEPKSVADLLELVLSDIAQQPKSERTSARYEVLRVAASLGSAGRPVVATVAGLHGDVGAVRSLAVHAALEARPDDQFVTKVADAVLGHCSPFPRPAHYETVQILDHLAAGLTTVNYVNRAQILAGKTRKLAAKEVEQTAFRWIGVEALGLEMQENPNSLPLLAHHLSRLLSVAPQYNVPFNEQWKCVQGISGEIGDRLRAQVLAVAADQPISDAIAHVATRIGHALTTAEDLALVNSIMDRDPTDEDLRSWVDACGVPSPTPAEEQSIPADWRRMWRWAAILPERVLAAWTPAIDQLSEYWQDRPSTEPLTVDHRPEVGLQFVERTSATVDLSTEPPLEVVAMLTAGESDADVSRVFPGPYWRTRALEDAVQNDPAAWSSCPSEIIEGLATDEFVEAYVRGLLGGIEDIVPQAPAVIDAVVPRLLQTLEPPDLTQPAGGSADSRDLQRVLLDLVRQLANHDGNVDSQLGPLWDVCDKLIANAPTVGELSQSPLERAYDASWSNGLLTMLTLAAWEHRNRPHVRAEFTQTLDTVIALTTASGLELRAILAAHRPILEHIAGDWLASRLQPLFRDRPFGRQTFELTVRWSQPTPWLYKTCSDDLFQAAKRNAYNAARILALCVIDDVPGYDIRIVVDRLAATPAALAETVEYIAFLVQNAASDAPILARAVNAWDYLLRTDAITSKDVALAGIGRWAFVTNIDDARWLKMIASTLEVTLGRIGHQKSVANKLARLPATDDTCTIFIALLDNADDQWDRMYIAGQAIDVLRAWQHPATSSARALRTRLIDLGYLDAQHIVLSTAASS
ncbi:hypothetical protein [Nocardia sp. NPDC060259]|uniref:hypothetical protein n=1 Tax=Nocardia sp. NPDC060259 TaxID=3347088 RepID=UPI00364F930B